MTDQQHNNISLVFIISLFFTWGFLTVLVDSLIPILRVIFELSYFEVGLVQFAFFLAYGLASIPAGEMLQRIGYRKGISRGLAIMGLGCLILILAADIRWYLLILIGLFTVAGGMTILQVAANPYVNSLGGKRRASARLNLAQAFNSLGTMIAPIIGAMYLLGNQLKTPAQLEKMDSLQVDRYLSGEIEAMQWPFIVMGVILLALAFAVRFMKLKEIKTEQSGQRLLVPWHSIRSLRLGAIGIFIYVGCEVAIGSYLVNYFLDMGLAAKIKSNPFMAELSAFLSGNASKSAEAAAIVGGFVSFYWGGAMIGRFIGAFALRWFKPKSILLTFSLGAIAMLIISMTSAGFAAMWSILAIGLFNSIMFPTIFSLSLEDVEVERRPFASGILCTAIVGGAIITPLFGFVADHLGFKSAMLLLVIGYSYIGSMAGSKRSWSLRAKKQEVLTT